MLKLKQSMIKTALFHIQGMPYKKDYILYPEDAWVKFRDFSPFNPVQIVATVYIPAIINMKECVVSHHIFDNDRIYS